MRCCVLKPRRGPGGSTDRKSTRLNSSHTVIYTLSLHDALPIYRTCLRAQRDRTELICRARKDAVLCFKATEGSRRINRSEEHTSELQSHSDLHSFPTRRSSDLPHVFARPTGSNRVDLPRPQGCGVVF